VAASYGWAAAKAANSERRKHSRHFVGQWEIAKQALHPHKVRLGPAAVAEAAGNNPKSDVRRNPKTLRKRIHARNESEFEDSHAIED
jgi:hypothetical protein